MKGRFAFTSICILLSLLSTILMRCSAFTYWNEPVDELEPRTVSVRAAFDIGKGRDGDENLVILALSGGGSRAAYFAAGTMFALEKKGILRKVDVISAVSGGSLPAAYYAISKDPEDTREVPSNRIWNEQTVRELMKRDYLGKWGMNCLWPDNILLYFLTGYDRSDVMAQTFADNLYDTLPFGFDLDFRDLNPERPYLILNSTNGTKNNFGGPFTFTREDFSNQLCSRIDDFPVSHAVMASAAFPGIFNYNTLRVFPGEPADNCRISEKRDDEDKYIHVFDGGVYDNLGLKSARRVIETAYRKYRYDNIIVILVDAYIEGGSIEEWRDDPRRGLPGYIIDSGVFDSSDNLLRLNREKILHEFGEFSAPFGDRLTFLHLKFDNLKKSSDPEIRELYDRLNRIPTNFNIDASAADDIDRAVELLLENSVVNGKNGRILQEIGELLEPCPIQSSGIIKRKNSN